MTMMRWGGLLCAAGLLSAAGITDAFYLPGKAPNSYTDGEKVCLVCLVGLPSSPLFHLVHRIYHKCAA